MSLLGDLRDRYFVKPVAQRIIDSVKATEKADNVPNIFSVPFSFNNAMATTNKQMTSSAVEFRTLRTISVSHETTRAAINARKRQITQLDYAIVDIDDAIESETTLDERMRVKAMMSDIGGATMRFRQILDLLMEDILVLDACVFYKQRTRGGKLLKIIPVDGATIKLRVGDGGERPEPPEIAFEQWIRNTKVAEMTTKDLQYEIMNPRTDSPYGLSPLESLLLTVDSSMKAALYNLNYLSDNNIPQGFLQVPEGWTVAQIKEYKEFFDAMVAGSKATSKIYPIPSGTTYQATSKPNDFSFKDFFDYLDRKVCMLYDIQPQELGLNLKQYKENADQQNEIQLRKGIKPLANFLQEIFTDLLRFELGYPQFAFKFVGLDGKYSVTDIKDLVPAGVLSIDEARNDRGLTKLGVGNIIVNGTSITPVSQLVANADGTIPMLEEEKANKQALLDAKQKQTEAMQTVNAGGMVTQQTKDEKKQPLNTKMDKKDNFMDKLSKAKEFRQFKRATKQAIAKTIEPFTKEEKIADLTKLEQVEFKKGMEDLSSDEFEITIDLNDFLKWAAVAGGQEAYSKLNVDGSFTLTSDKFSKLLGDRETYIIDSVSDTTKQWIIDQITTGKAAGLTNAAIADQISGNSEEISASRADTIVNTEVANASQLTELDTYKEQGVEMKMWMLSEDIGDECGANADDGAIPVGDSFSSGDDAPPLHPNCRCYIDPVLDTLN
jgi:SPP1 gp7 family putative phage head morphogenesis protein